MTASSSEIGDCSKGFTVDTSVLLHDPDVITALAKDRDNLVVIPLCVLEELDRVKRDPGEKGFNARAVARMLDDLRQNGEQSLQTGVRIGPNKGIVLVDHNGKTVKEVWSDLEDTTDNKILVVAKKWQDRLAGSKITIITKDINMRLKADAVGIPANDYLKDKAVRTIDELYTGLREIRIDDPSGTSALTDLAQRKEIPASVLARSVDVATLFPNQCCQIHYGGKYLLAVYKKCEGVFKYVPKPHKLEGKGKDATVKPINDGQALLYYLLWDPSVHLVTARGKAGTGKSLITLLGGHEQFRKDIYKFLLIYKPIIEVGERTLGLLPGDLQEKMQPWEAAIYDSFNLIIGDDMCEKDGRDNPKPLARMVIEDHLRRGNMEISPISYIRGRSLNSAFIVVDEAQNLSPHEVKTLITRVGKGSKIVLVGDTDQIDNPYLDPTSNGLSRTIELLKHHELTGHITLTQGERSKLAELAANLM